MNDIQSLVQNILLEVRRGVIAIAVLSQLQEEMYGYSLIKHLADLGLNVDQGTLYPLLRRMESQGLLQSSWRLTDDTHPRRYYVLSATGRKALASLKEEWTHIADTMQQMLIKKGEQS